MSDGRRSDGDDLDRRIAAARSAHDPERVRAHIEATGESRGMAAGIEFVGAVLVSTFIGWALDQWLHTTPWLLIIFLVLGFAAGLRGAIKAGTPLNSEPANKGATSDHGKHGH